MPGPDSSPDAIKWRVQMEVKMATIMERFEGLSDKYASKQDMTGMKVKMWIVMGVFSFIGTTVGGLILAAILS